MSDIALPDMNEFRLELLIKALGIISNQSQEESTRKYASKVLELDNEGLKIYGVIQDENS